MPVYPVEWLRREWRSPETLRERVRGNVFATPSRIGEENRDIRCPGCGAAAPTAPIRSRYHQPDRVEHDWCCGCGAEWTTSTRVPK